MTRFPTIVRRAVGAAVVLGLSHCSTASPTDSPAAMAGTDTPAAGITGAGINSAAGAFNGAGGGSTGASGTMTGAAGAMGTSTVVGADTTSSGGAATTTASAGSADGGATSTDNLGTAGTMSVGGAPPVSDNSAGADVGVGGASEGGGGMPTMIGGQAGMPTMAGGGGAGGSQAAAQPCPDDAAFCSGFETDELPEGAVFMLFGDPATPWTALFEVDTTVHFSGASSLRVKKNAEPDANTQYKMLAVPSGGTAFWARMYLRSDVELGQEGHNAYAAASVTTDPNDGSRVEFADDVGLAFNASDDVRWPEGYGRLMSGETNPYTLPANEWHCIELHFDGPGRSQTLYVDGEELITTSDYPASAIDYATFKFGYWGFHNEADRGVWYDDVAVGPTRIGCLAE